MALKKWKIGNILIMAMIKITIVETKGRLLIETSDLFIRMVGKNKNR